MKLRILALCLSLVALAAVALTLSALEPAADLTCSAAAADLPLYTFTVSFESQGCTQNCTSNAYCESCYGPGSICTSGGRCLFP